MNNLAEVKELLAEKYAKIPDYKRIEQKDFRSIMKALDSYLRKYGAW